MLGWAPFWGRCAPTATTATELRAFDKARQYVSGNKRRFQEDGFDLDLSYVTPRIVAMGFPSTGLEAVIRNPLSQVQKFFADRHGGHFKVYNLCSERDYDLKGVFPLVERFPFPDHNPCPMDMLLRLMESVAEYLAADRANIVAIHCKAGKGRTGMVIAAILLHLGLNSTALEALQFFAERRTFNGEGVTIPSERRYVHYYEKLLRCGIASELERVRLSPVAKRVVLPRPTFELRGIRLSTIPHFNSIAGSSRCTPYVKVVTREPGTREDGPWEEVQVFSLRGVLAKRGKELKSFDYSERYTYLDCAPYGVRVSGEVGIKLYATQQLAQGKKMCHVWFHTAFLKGGRRVLQFNKDRIDSASKDKKHKKFTSDFSMQVHMRSIEDVPDADTSMSEAMSTSISEVVLPELPGCGIFSCSGMFENTRHWQCIEGTESDFDSEEIMFEHMEEPQLNRKVGRVATAPAKVGEIMSSQVSGAGFSVAHGPSMSAIRAGGGSGSGANTRPAICSMRNSYQGPGFEGGDSEDQSDDNSDSDSD